MKWLRNSLVGLALLAFCYSHVGAAVPKEKLLTIFLRLYTGNTVEEYIDAHLEEAETLILDLNITKPTVVYIHGYTESVNDTSVLTVVNAYLNRKDHNVLAVDWSVIASDNYLKVSASVNEVGILVAMALNDIVHAGLPSENIHVIGHSMGAHVAGFVGTQVDFSLQRITGLDPAGPLFNFIGRHLKRSDARFVDIIHTDTGYYGIVKKTGNVDFYPNGGRRIQPGCPTKFSFLSVEDFCSHHRSWHYYSESVTKEKSFLAIECSSPIFRQRRSSSPIIMGYAVPTDAKGFYCLVTASSAPYGLGNEGARLI